MELLGVAAEHQVPGTDAGIRGQKVLGPWKEEERVVTGAADGFLRMVSVQLYHGGIL